LHCVFLFFVLPGAPCARNTRRPLTTTGLHRLAKCRYNELSSLSKEDTIKPLSPAALTLFRLHVERGGHLDVDDTTREAYRELARAGLMQSGHTYTKGDESIYRLTKEGFERKAELLAKAAG
jgi:hypothetical protein